MLSATMRGFLARVTGPQSHSLFRLFGDQCRELDSWLHEIAERARACGLVSRMGAAELARSARAAVAPPPDLPARNMIDELLVKHEAIAADLRRDLAACSGAPAINELLVRLVEFHETTAWMLRMVLERPEVPRSRR